MKRFPGWSMLVAGAVVIAAWAGSVSVSAAAAPQPNQVIYNGIELPAVWPPKPKEFLEHPQKPPYLVTPPKVIVIDVGRQLLVDDFLIAQTDLKRTWHLPELDPGNPLLKPDKPWEMVNGRPYAMPFSDAMLYDPQDRIFKAWYFAAGGSCTCYATSKDGKTWEKPLLDVVPGTNIVLREPRDSTAIWLDPKPARSEERFKMALYRGNFKLFRSPDGIHWTKVSDGAPTGDRSTFFYNPFRERWVYSIRSGSKYGRSRHYWETTDFFSFSKAVFDKGEASIWITADSQDWIRDDLKARPQLYNLDCTAYESVLLGLFSIWRGDYRGNPPTQQAKDRLAEGRPKQNSLCVGFSRDGFHWDRPDRRAFIPTSEKRGDWNFGNVQATAPGCLVMGDQLWFYFSGRYGKGFPGDARSLDSGGCAGLATLRRDGFASMDAAGSPGTLTTRLLRFKGKHLFVNFSAPAGELRAEVLDEDQRPIEPFDREHCRPLKGDSTRQAAQWEGGADLSALAGKPVRLRFHLTGGSLYSFWITPDAGGASYGYLAGGPEFNSPQDLPKK